MPAKLFNSYTSTNGTKAESQAKINQLQSSNPDAWNSLIFDTKRRSIWAQGQEYGGGSLGAGNLEFSYSYHSAYITTNSSYLNNEGDGNARAFVTSVTYYLDDNEFKLGYSYAYESVLTTKNSNTGDFLRGISASGHNITYSYGSFTTNKAGTATTHTAYLVGVDIDSTGKLSYNYAEVNHKTNTGELKSPIVPIFEIVPWLRYTGAIVEPTVPNFVNEPFDIKIGAAVVPTVPL